MFIHQDLILYNPNNKLDCKNDHYKLIVYCGLDKEDVNDRPFFGLLEKIIGALGFDSEDALVITKKTEIDSRVRNIQGINKEQLIISFGVEERKWSNLSLVVNKPIIHLGKTYLKTKSLQLLAESQQEKKALWSVLKTLKNKVRLWK